MKSNCVLLVCFYCFFLNTHFINPILAEDSKQSTSNRRHQTNNPLEASKRNYMTVPMLPYFSFHATYPSKSSPLTLART